MEALRNLPTPLLLAGGCLTTALLLVLTGLGARRVPASSIIPTASLEAYKIIVTFTAILLSFTLVQAEGMFRRAEAAASHEASSLNQLDRLLARYHAPATDAIRPVLQAYMQHIVQVEWPAMRGATGDPGTPPQLVSLNRAVQTLENGTPAKPVLYAEMLKHLDTINDTRQERMDSSEIGVSEVIWLADAALCTLLLALSTLINIPGRLVSIGGHAMAITVLLVLTFTVDSPYRGHVSVSPAPIERVIAATRLRMD